MSIARMMQQASAGAYSATSGGGSNTWTDPDLANASYDSKSFSVATQETVPFDLDFKPDGTSFVIVGQTNDTAYQYNCSVAWDISTASYASKSLSLSSQSTSPRCILFNNDGTKMYVLGSPEDRIFEYSLTTPYDISTGSYSNVSLDLNTAISSSVSFSGNQFSIPSGGDQDGTKLYVGCYNTDKIYSWTLGTAWDLSTASLDSTNFNVLSYDGVHAGINVNSDGTKWWISARVSDKIIQFSMSTPYDISTSTKDTAELSWLGQTNDGYGFRFKDNGTKLYLMGTNDDTIYQYSTVSSSGSNTWTDPDLANASYDSVSFSGTIDNIPVGLTFKPDGTSMFIIGNQNDNVYQYTLSTAWDVSTASYASKSFNVATQDNAVSGFAFKSDGTAFYHCSSRTDTVYQYTLSTAWDVSTASYASKSFSVSTLDGNPRQINFSPTGDKLWFTGLSSDYVYELDLSTDFDISTASYNNINYNAGTQDSYPVSTFFKSDGSKMYVIGITNDTVYQYST